MYRFLRVVSKITNVNNGNASILRRTFLSSAYYCNEVWENRLKNPILQKVNFDELYNELDQKFSKTRNISAVDVDVFANAVNNELYVNELLDILYKLRLSADTGNMLTSTSHAVVRYLTKYGRTEDLMRILEDRLNYGIFLDAFTANLLMNSFHKTGDFLSGVRVAAQLMLQEDVEHPISKSLSLLHCYNYLLNPTEWPSSSPPEEEPEEEVKIRVKYLRNPYFDDHFDLTDSHMIVGKTMWMNTMGLHDDLHKSLHVVGLGLHQKVDQVMKLIEDVSSNKVELYKEALDLLPDSNEVKEQLKNCCTKSGSLKDLLEENVKQNIHSVGERDITEQCKTYLKWEEERKDALDKQYQRLLTMQRLKTVDEMKQNLKEKEVKLWFFENEDKLELDMEAKSIYLPKNIAKKIKGNKIDETYIPPEVGTKSSTR